MNAPPTYHREHVRAGPLSISTQIYQGLGALPDTYKNFAFGSLLLFYYNQVLGLPAARASFALMLALVIDAIRRHAMARGGIELTQAALGAPGFRIVEDGLGHALVLDGGSLVAIRP